MSVYKQIMKAMVDLELDINITKEDIRNSTEARHIRVNELSLALSTQYVLYLLMVNIWYFINDLY